MRTEDGAATRHHDQVKPIHHAEGEAAGHETHTDAVARSTNTNSASLESRPRTRRVPRLS